MICACTAVCSGHRLWQSVWNMNIEGEIHKPCMHRRHAIDVFGERGRERERERGLATETEYARNEWRELVLLPLPPPPPTTDRRFSSISCHVFDSVHILRACTRLPCGVDGAVSDTRKTFNSKATMATATLQAAEQDKRQRKHYKQEIERERERTKRMRTELRASKDTVNCTESRRLQFFFVFFFRFVFLFFFLDLHSTSFNFFSA